MYKLREERDIEPKTLAESISSTLYEKRYTHILLERNESLYFISGMNFKIYIHFSLYKYINMMFLKIDLVHIM